MRSKHKTSFDLLKKHLQPARICIVDDGKGRLFGKRLFVDINFVESKILYTVQQNKNVKAFIARWLAKSQDRSRGDFNGKPVEKKHAGSREGYSVDITKYDTI